MNAIYLHTYSRGFAANISWDFNREDIQFGVLAARRAHRIFQWEGHDLEVGPKGQAEPQSNPSQKTKTSGIWPTIFGWVLVFDFFSIFLFFTRMRARARLPLPPPLVFALDSQDVFALQRSSSHVISDVNALFVVEMFC